MCIFTSSYSSPLGPITIASDGSAIIGLWFDGQKYDKATISQSYSTQSDDVIRSAKKWLDIYFQGKNPGFTPSLKVQGSEFKQMVANIMLDIPYGKTITYADIAREVALRTGQPHMSAQAVGGAVGHNAISLIIPCHRVVGTNGSLTGYAGGLERKRKLLIMEGALQADLFTAIKQ